MSFRKLSRQFKTKTRNAQLKILQQFAELLGIFAKGRQAIKEFFTKLADEIGKWFVENNKAFKKFEDLLVEDLDWMSSRRIGALGGKVLKSSQIRKLRGILKQKGIKLIVEGDGKSITRSFTSIENFKIFDELILFMKSSNPQKVGTFHAPTKQFVLIRECTEIMAFHEMAHLKQFEQLGEAYFKLSKLDKEMYVWEQILAYRNNWQKLNWKTL